jgi:hypothetical protein
MTTLTNFAARDVEALLHPNTNLGSHRSSGPGDEIHTMFDRLERALDRGHEWVQAEGMA